MKVFLIGNNAATELYKPSFLDLGLGQITGRKSYSLAYFFHEIFNLYNSLETYTDEHGNTRRHKNKGLCFHTLKQAQDYCIKERQSYGFKNIPVASTYNTPRPAESVPIIYELEIQETSLTSNAYRKYPESMRLSDEMIQNAILRTIRFCDKTYEINRPVTQFPNYTLEAFKSAYIKQYCSEFFKNPWSKMKHWIEIRALEGEDNMSHVYDYAYRNPKSRTAKVLRDMFAADKTLLLNPDIDAAPAQNSCWNF